MLVVRFYQRFLSTSFRKARYRKHIAFTTICFFGFLNEIQNTPDKIVDNPA
jgi:hypothetical protein